MPFLNQRSWTGRLAVLAVYALVSPLQAAFQGDPPDEHHPWALRDENRPEPPMVIPGPKVGDAPSDALVLFDGTEASLRNCTHEKPDDKRLLESLVYEFDETAWRRAAGRADHYIRNLKGLASEQRQVEKRQARLLRKALGNLVQYKCIENVELLDSISEITEAEGWLKNVRRDEAI